MDIEKLKKLVATAQTESNKAEGRLTALRDELREKWGCKSPKDVKDRLAKLVQLEADAKATYETTLEEFENDHAETLERLASN